MGTDSVPKWNSRKLLEQVNLPELILILLGVLHLPGLTRVYGGVICDPRPGHTERHPSFSVFLDGLLWRWKRHSGDGASGTAIDLLLAFGYSERAAWNEVRRLVGGQGSTWIYRGRTSTLGVQPLNSPREQYSSTMRLSPFNATERTQLDRLILPLRKGSPASMALAQRGLLDWPGLRAGQLAREYITRDGRRLAHEGALAIVITGPDGQPWGLKVRNLQPGMGRYVYCLSGHGSPAWCSPDYGRGDHVLIVEGELNGAAAARALESRLSRVDVQGLAGARTNPFTEGLAGKTVYVYADPDDAGRAALERVGQLAREAGAAEVRVLPALPAGDFCDVAGTEGPAQLSKTLGDLFSAATTDPPIARDGGGNSTAVKSTQIRESGVKVQGPQRGALRKYEARLARKAGGRW